jgi:hypothetical protein
MIKENDQDIMSNYNIMKLVHCVGQLIMEKAEDRLSEVQDDEVEYYGSIRTKSPLNSVYVPQALRRFPSFFSAKDENFIAMKHVLTSLEKHVVEALDQQW